MPRRGLIGAALVCALFLPAASARATVPPGFTETLVTAGLNAPTAMAFAPDGRLFVAEQGGALRVIENGVLLETPFVELPVDSSGERGLLGVAFDPNFSSPTSKFVYVYYTTATEPIHNRITRLTAAGNVALPGSEVPILELDNLSAATNHNGGAIHFGPDGKLYAAVGENANPANAQVLTNLLGKMLRINPDGTIPEDNPFYDDTTGNNRAIWALGLRNPFTFGFQPGTGRMFINDVGESTWEEINDGIAGSNYGWPQSEGMTNLPGIRSPLFAYGHGPGLTTGCAIVGAAFYNPPAVQFPPDYVGDYFFGDLCNGWIRRFDPGTGTASPFASDISLLVDIAIAADGSLYYAALGTGGIYRVTGPPTAVAVRTLAATRSRAGVVLRWRLEAGSRVLGFNVYRGGLRLNRALLPSASRAFVDRLAPRNRTLRYRLEVVLADGTRVSHRRIARR